MEKMDIYITALTLSTLAGLSTIIGGLVTLFVKRNSMKVLSVGLGFSAGVMIFISLVSLLPESRAMTMEHFGKTGGLITLLFFTLGIIIAVLIDYFLPDHLVNPEAETPCMRNCAHNFEHEKKSLFETPEHIQKIKRAGLTTTIAVMVHNLPEGLTTFYATTASLKLGLTIFLAIAIHNIPEGIAISLPIYQATGSKRKALLYCALSGLAEPIGGVLGFAFIHFFFPQMTIGLMFALIAGIMTYISFDTMLPLAREYDTAHYSITGVVLGMLLMGLTVLVF